MNNFVIPNNIRLDYADGILFWYIWGKNLKIEMVSYYFKTIFIDMLKMYDELQTVVFYIDSIDKTYTRTACEILYRDNDNIPMFEKYKLMQRYKASISQLVMFGADYCKTIVKENHLITVKKVNFTGLHALIAGQLNYLQSRIVTI